MPTIKGYNKTKNKIRYGLQVMTQGLFNRLITHKAVTFKSKNCQKVMLDHHKTLGKNQSLWITKLGSDWEDWIKVVEKNNGIIVEDLGDIYCEVSKQIKGSE